MYGKVFSPSIHSQPAFCSVCVGDIFNFLRFIVDGYELRALSFQLSNVVKYTHKKQNLKAYSSRLTAY
jgi:hypothetical protein